MKGIGRRFGIAMIKLYRIVFAWLPSSVPLRAELFALHRAGHREVRAREGILDGRQAYRPMPTVGWKWL